MNKEIRRAILLGVVVLFLVNVVMVSVAVTDTAGSSTTIYYKLYPKYSSAEGVVYITYCTNSPNLNYVVFILKSPTFTHTVKELAACMTNPISVSSSDGYWYVTVKFHLFNGDVIVRHATILST